MLKILQSLIISILILLQGCGPSNENVRTYGSNPTQIDLHARGTSGIASSNYPTDSSYHALVIGNNAYQHIGTLKNAVSDAQAVAQQFQALGYRVTLRTNRTRSDFWDDIETFSASIAQNDQVIIFYAGHGVQVKNGNYLIPIDLKATKASHIERDGIELSSGLLAKVQTGQPRFVLAIIDACRNNPFRSMGRSIGASRGLASPSAVHGTMIVYSAGIGQQALDALSMVDPIPHGLFTRELLTALKIPNITINQAFGQVKSRVYTQAKSVGHTQTPAIYDQSIGTFYFQTSQSVPQQQSNPQVLAKPQVPNPQISTPQAPVIAATPPISTAAADAEAARLAALETKRKQEEAKIARLRQEQIAAKQAAAQAQAKAERLERQDRARKAAQAKEAARLATLEQKRRAEEARIARLQRQRAEEERKAQAAKAEADRLARLNARREEARREAARQEAARRARAEAQARARRSRKPYEPEMVSIPGGCFQMGSPTSEAGRGSDENQHRVCVKAFHIGKYEVTNAQYRAFKPSHNSGGNFNDEQKPVVNVSWQDAHAYTQWLSKKTGRKYRLPTEAEWEYAARAGTTTPFHTGNCISTNQANYDGNYPYSGCPKGQYREKTIKVGSFSPNAWGLHDMSGNVWEWTCSKYTSSYDGSEKKCLLSGGAARVLRGGSWDYNAGLVRAAYRGSDEPGDRHNYVGFRACEVIEPSR